MDSKSYNLITTMDKILVTNNILVYDKYKASMDITYKEGFSYLDVLSYSRDLVHQGHELLTHPLSGSIKPNETPFKTIIVSSKARKLDYNSLRIIEDSIQVAKKFLLQKSIPNWSDRVLDDFRLIDLSLIENIIDMNFK